MAGIFAVLLITAIAIEKDTLELDAETGDSMLLAIFWPISVPLILVIWVFGKMFWSTKKLAKKMVNK
jgi:hypothetical protein